MGNGNGRCLGLVIGAGSVKCAAAIGLENVLRRENIGIDLVVGCSGGALYAALIAMGYEAQRARELTLKLWTHELTAKHHRQSALHVLLPQVFGFNEDFGIVDDRLALERLDEIFGGYTFAECRIPLYIVATDFHTGEQVVFSEGSLLDAIRASIAIPFVFSPWRVGDRLLVDGFLSDPMPVDVAINAGAQVVLSMGFESEYQHHINSAPRFAFQLSSIITNNLFKSNYELARQRHAALLVPVIPEFNQRIHLFDTAKIPYVIEEGERTMEQQLPLLSQMLSEGCQG